MASEVLDPAPSLLTDGASAGGPSFSEVIPLPFRVLSLVSLGILGWASNVQFLAFLGIDVPRVLDVRTEPSHHWSLSRALTSAPPPPLGAQAYVHPKTLYAPAYKLAALLAAWTLAGWWAFRLLAGGAVDSIIMWRANLITLQCFVLLVPLVVLVWPGNIFYRAQRYRFLRAVWRVVNPSLRRRVSFSDVILADVLTSFAKVFGDIWVAGCLLIAAGSADTLGRSGWRASACHRDIMVPLMTTLPYCIRFRQCLAEYVTSDFKQRRSLLNALKYASAFPVILFSVLQKRDESSEGTESRGGWLGPDSPFQLWVLAVLVNSLYSFWWDITNDWGFSILAPSTWLSNPNPTFSDWPLPGRGHARGTSVAARLFSSFSGASVRSALESPLPRPAAANDDDIGEKSRAAGSSTAARPPSPSKTHSPHASFSSPSSTTLFGLRPVLLFPDVSAYHLSIFLDLILRLTWSLKLSSHLHDVIEFEGGVFVMEALEVLRRWMWVFFRIEWECVKAGKSGGQAYEPLNQDEEGVGGPDEIGLTTMETVRSE